MAYQDVVLADSPTAYWRLNESVSPVADTSGNANGGTFGAGVTTGATGALAGDSNKAISFAQASGGHIVVTPVSPTTLSAPFTVEAWAKLASTPATYAWFGSRGGTEFGCDFMFLSTGLHGDLGTGSGWVDTAADYTFTPATGVWYHIVYTVTTAAWIIYLNGIQVATNTLSGTTLLWNATHIPWIGGGGSVALEYFDGTLDEVAVYPVALSAARVLTHYSVGVTAALPRVLGGATQSVKRGSYY